MPEKHVVRFEPVGIEIEVDEDQTVLRAAFEQGVMLPHGCKEGQCASCKSFVLEGDDIELDRYSTFALPDFEREEGYTLLCRAHAYEDLTVELLHYDEDIIRSGLPIQQAVTEVVSNEPVTHDMRHLVVRLVEPQEIKFFPGQYLDFTIPGTTGHAALERVEVLMDGADRVRMSLVLQVPRHGETSAVGPRTVTGDFTRPENALPAVEALLLQIADPDPSRR